MHPHPLNNGFPDASQSLSEIRSRNPPDFSESEFLSLSLKKEIVKRQHRTILIAEDQPDDAFLLERAFRANNITDPMHIVTNGTEAIAYLRGEGKYSNREIYEFPSFIISDLKMPGQDGFAILEALHSRPEWSVVPMIILSGSADENDIERAYMLCAKAYLVKPASFEELRLLVKKFHDFWSLCETPRVNKDGEKLPTNGDGKIGTRYKGMKQSALRTDIPHLDR
jgi:CheY-like chemotaxis protein